MALLFQEWSAARPSRTLPTGKTPYPLYRRLGGPQARSGRAENLDSIPDRPARRSVTIPTELPGPQGTYRQAAFLNQIFGRTSLWNFRLYWNFERKETSWLFWDKEYSASLAKAKTRFCLKSETSKPHTVLVNEIISLGTKFAVTINLVLWELDTSSVSTLYVKWLWWRHGEPLPNQHKHTHTHTHTCAGLLSFQKHSTHTNKILRSCMWGQFKTVIVTEVLLIC